MNSNNSKMNLKNIHSQTNYLVTAWQISSTLTNMEQFINIIQKNSSTKQKLESILPFVNKIKKIEQIKQKITKQFHQLVEQSNISQYLKSEKSNLNLQTQSLNSKKTSKSNMQHKQQLKIGKHKKRLREMVINLKKQNLQNSIRLEQIQKQIQKNKKNNLKQKQYKKVSLIKGFDEKINHQSKVFSDKINKQTELYFRKNNQPIYARYIQNNLKTILNANSEIKSANIKSSEQNQQLILNQSQICTQILSNSDTQQSRFKELIAQSQIGIGQVKCKLLSLQDKKRKITVQNLLNANFLHQLNDKNAKRIQQNLNFNTFSSFFTIFSKKNQKQKQQNQTFTNSAAQQLQISVKKQVSNEIIQENQMNLRIIQIKSQILQLKQHVQIGTRQNIFQELISCLSQIKQINSQIRPLIKEAIKLNYLFQKKKLIFEKQGHKNYNSSQNSSHDEGNNCQEKKNQFYDKQNIDFFLGVIQERISARHSLTRRICFKLNKNLQILIKYINKRLIQIKSSFLKINEEVKQQQQQKKQVIKSEKQAQNSINKAYNDVTKSTMDLNLVIDSAQKHLRKLSDSKLQSLIDLFTIEYLNYQQGLEKLSGNDQVEQVKSSNQTLFQEIDILKAENMLKHSRLQVQFSEFRQFNFIKKILNRNSRIIFKMEKFSCQVRQKRQIEHEKQQEQLKEQKIINEIIQSNLFNFHDQLYNKVLIILNESE